MFGVSDGKTFVLSRSKHVYALLLEKKKPMSAKNHCEQWKTATRGWHSDALFSPSLSLSLSGVSALLSWLIICRKMWAGAARSAVLSLPILPSLPCQRGNHQPTPSNPSSYTVKLMSLASTAWMKKWMASRQETKSNLSLQCSPLARYTDIVRSLWM